MLHNTNYTLHQDGESIPVFIIYRHEEPTPFRGEFIEVQAIHPALPLTPRLMEEIELECWTDIMTKSGYETCIDLEEPAVAEELQPQEIPQCRKHFSWWHLFSESLPHFLRFGQ